MSRTVVVVNRGAGGGRAALAWERMAQAEAGLVGARIIARDTVEGALEDLGGALAGGAVERVVAVGGDGTLSRLADLLLAAPGPGGAPLPLGIVPCGTGCDLARALGVPRDPAAALRHALAAPARSLDALEVLPAGGPRRFGLNVVSAGVSGPVVDAVAEIAPRGRATYLRATLAALARYRPLAMRVSVDGEGWFEGEVLLIAVANGPTFGRGMKIAPEADLQDGLADVVLVPRMASVQVALHLPLLYLGRHLRSPKVLWRRGREVQLDVIEPTDPVPSLDVDGDAWPAGSVRIVVHPGALRIVA